MSGADDGPMRIGADYYPEHWPRERWPRDAALMREAGFNTVRLAEFAWAQMEPAEGVFDFEWLDEALRVLAAEGISALLGTPTASIPAWAARAYPECLAVRADGRRAPWGSRKNTCLASPDFRRLSRRVTGAMAEHFRDTPGVIGWQTDNEFSGSPDFFCHCDACRDGFRAWLKERHGDLAALNRRLGLRFWGHLFGDWDEIPVPADRESGPPGLCLEYHRFTSDLNVSFQAEQVRILRETCPGRLVTHNLMGLSPQLNTFDLGRDLDVAAWDNYPVRNGLDTPFAAAAGADLTRGVKRRNFWIMEQTAGPAGWGLFGRNPKPGEIRKVAFQQLARGADAQLWFRWRTCTAGREQYWHGLLGHDGKPLRRYGEAARTAREFQALWPRVRGTTVRARAAFVYDYDSLWALQLQPGFHANVYADTLLRYYRALFRAGVNVDLVPPDGPLEDYALLLAPDLHVLPDALARRLDAFVKAGGVLLADCRTGVKDEWNVCHERTLPGLLSDALGIAIEEYGSLEHPGGSAEVRVRGKGALAGAFTAFAYTDWLTPAGAEPLAGYEGEAFLEPFAAASRHRHGRGWGYYVGTLLREEAFYDLLVRDLLEKAGLPALPPPEGVERSVREDGARRLLFLVNHAEEERTVDLPPGGRDLLGAEAPDGQLTLPPFGVAVVDLAAAGEAAGAAEREAGR